MVDFMTDIIVIIRMNYEKYIKSEIINTKHEI